MKEVYYLDKVETEYEVNEYIETYIIKNNIKKEFLKIKLDKIQFVIFLIPVDADIEAEKIEILKTSNLIKYGKIKIGEKNYKIETKKCYIIKYLKQKGYEELVEEIIEREIEKEKIKNCKLKCPLENKK